MTPNSGILLPQPPSAGIIDVHHHPRAALSHKFCHMFLLSFSSEYFLIFTVRISLFHGFRRSVLFTFQILVLACLSFCWLLNFMMLCSKNIFFSQQCFLTCRRLFYRQHKFCPGESPWCSLQLRGGSPGYQFSQGACYCRSYLLSLLPHLAYFQWGSCQLLPGLPLKWECTFSTFWVGGITGVCHHTWPLSSFLSIFPL
jgi:hypothetical protein